MAKAQRISRRSQSAVENLIVYGMAVLIIIVVFYILYNYGFLLTSRAAVQNSCQLSSGAACSDILIISNAITSNTQVVTLFATTTSPLLDPYIIVKIGNTNSSKVSCIPNYVNVGGAIICQSNVPIKSALNQPVTGKLYLFAQHCGVSVPGTCATLGSELYTGIFSGYAQPISNSIVTISLTANQIMNSAPGYDYLANATVLFAGTPVLGATVNFSLNNTKLASLSENYNDTNSSGFSTVQVFDPHSNEVKLYANLSKTVSSSIILPPYCTPFTQVYYIPIVISGQAVPDGFQQIIKFNPSLYSRCEAPDLGNIRFLQFGQPGPAKGAITLDSWCESGCNSTSKSAMFWVVLPNGIPTTPFELAFEPPASGEYEYAIPTAGEAPNQSVKNGGTYGEYDNGATVFPLLYQNFEGTMVPIGWQSAGLVTINNGASIPHDAYLLSDASFGDTSNQIVDIYSTNWFPATVPFDGNMFAGFAAATKNANPSSAIGWSLASTSHEGTGDWSPATLNDGFLTYGTYNLETGSVVLSTQLNQGGYTGEFFYNYTSIRINFRFFGMSASPVGIWAYWNLPAVTDPIQTMQWIRVRDYPFAGEMPSAPVTGNPTTILSSGNGGGTTTISTTTTTGTTSASSSSSSTMSTTSSTIIQQLLASISASPGPSVDLNQPIQLSSSVTGGTAPYSYQWYTLASAADPAKCFSFATNAIAGATSSSYTTIPMNTPTTYCLKVTDSDNNAATSGILLSVNPPLLVSLSASPANVINSGQSATVTAAVSGGTGTYSYQWGTATAPASCPGNPIFGDNSISYSSPPLTQQTIFCLGVTDSDSNYISNSLVVSVASAYYLPITLSGSNSEPDGFQQLVAFNPSSYPSYVKSDLGNIRFMQGSQLLNSWCESGCSAASGSAVFWIVLPNGIPTGGIPSPSLNLVFELPGNSLYGYDGTIAGESPEQSISNGGTYGEYDNGAKVFNFYQSGSNSWATSGQAGAITTAPAGSPFGGDALYADGASGDYEYLNSGLPGTSNYIIQYYIQTTDLGDFFFMANGNGLGSMSRITKRGGFYSGLANTISFTSVGTSPTETGATLQPNIWYMFQVDALGTSSGEPEVGDWYSQAPSYEGPLTQLNGLGPIYPTTYSPFTTYSPDGSYFALVGDTGGGVTYLNGMIVRLYPTGGAMPSDSMSGTPLPIT